MATASTVTVPSSAETTTSYVSTVTITVFTDTSSTDLATALMRPHPAEVDRALELEVGVGHAALFQLR